MERAKVRAVKAAAKLGQPWQRSFFPKHPFPMKTTFRKCFLVNFRMEPEALRRNLPPHLEPDIFNGKAFLSVVIADLEAMRLGFLPRCVGSDFTQVVYRAIVRAPTGERGVHFLRSDADDATMSTFGNLFSNFKFNLARFRWQDVADSGANNAAFSMPHVGASGSCRFKCYSSDGVGDVDAEFDRSKTSLVVSAGSLHAGRTLAEAREYFCELYAAFTSDETRWNAVRIKRSEWNIVMLPDTRGRYDFMQRSEQFPPGACELDSVIYAADMDYHWYTLQRYPIKQP